MSIRRFTPDAPGEYDEDDAPFMRECEIGGWVKYDDHILHIELAIAALWQLQQEVINLRHELEECRRLGGC